MSHNPFFTGFPIFIRFTYYIRLLCIEQASAHVIVEWTLNRSKTRSRYFIVFILQLHEQIHYILLFIRIRLQSITLNAVKGGRFNNLIFYRCVFVCEQVFSIFKCCSIIINNDLGPKRTEYRLNEYKPERARGTLCPK